MRFKPIRINRSISHCGQCLNTEEERAPELGQVQIAFCGMKSVRPDRHVQSGENEVHRDITETDDKEKSKPSGGHHQHVSVADNVRRAAAAYVERAVLIDGAKNRSRILLR